MTGQEEKCHVCNDTGFFVGEGGVEAVCLECQHIDWSVKSNVYDRSAGQYSAGLCGRGRSATTDLPSIQYKGYNTRESCDWSAVSRNQPRPVLPVSTHVRLGSQEPSRCPRCGASPFVEEQMHGHYVCMTCHTITVGCCDGECG